MPSRRTASGATRLGGRVTIPRMKRTALLLVGFSCLLPIGCVQRTISITSEPKGALVYLNDVEVGRTPVTVPFTFYGVYDVRMEAEGYQPLWTKQKAKAPWWETPGVDLLAEAVPKGKAELNWHFTMNEQLPADQVDADVLLDHAKQLRAVTSKPALTGQLDETVE